MTPAEFDAFRSWFYASKYAQVIIPTDANMQIAQDGWQAGVAHERERAARVDAQYNELIMAVASKYEGETRHQTALRYINQAETNDHDPVGRAAAIRRGD